MIINILYTNFIDKINCVFYIYGTIPSDVPQYLIGDEERKYKHFPICVRKGWDYRVALDNSHTYSSTIWNFKNELYYSWIKRYSNEWTKIKVQVDDNERTIRFFINDALILFDIKV